MGIFSKASLVMMSSGRMLPRLISLPTTAPPAARASPAALAGEMAFCAEEFGSDMPSASMAQAMVFAVYMPPQAPAPGNRVFLGSSASSRSSIWPLACLPTASKQRDDVERLVPEQIVHAAPSRFSRFSARMPVMQLRAGSCRHRREHRGAGSSRRHGHQAAGHVLVGSRRWPRGRRTAFATHHRLDGIGDHFARDEREYFIPSVPIEMPYRKS